MLPNLENIQYRLRLRAIAAEEVMIRNNFLLFFDTCFTVSESLVNPRSASTALVWAITMQQPVDHVSLSIGRIDRVNKPNHC
jgi:hypothetical protein